jgi:hypothetical protein
MMGSYSSQLNEKQRWQVIAYIKQMQSQNGGDAFTMGQTDSTAAKSGTATASAQKDTTAAEKN